MPVASFSELLVQVKCSGIVQSQIYIRLERISGAVPLSYYQSGMIDWLIFLATCCDQQQGDQYVYAFFHYSHPPLLEYTPLETMEISLFISVPPVLSPPPSWLPPAMADTVIFAEALFVQ